jgi:site-specific DNA-methyltransferase (adenine-specific)
MKALPDNCIDSVVTDPPYGLQFMGREWDKLWRDKTDADVAWRDAHDGTLAARARKLPDYATMQRGEQMQQTHLEWAREAFRVLKPGGHIAAFSASRTYHRMTSAIEDAGFEIRDSLMWLYGTGFPKSHDVSKGIDKLDAADMRRERQLRFTEWMRSTGLTSARIDELTGTNMGGHYTTAASQPAVATRDHFETLRPHFGCAVPAWVEAMVDERTVESENFKRRAVIGVATNGSGNGCVVGLGTTGNLQKVHDITAPATNAAREFEGWGTALKPAFEPIVLARKPMSEGTVAANVMRWGTGAINVGATRVGNETLPAQKAGQAKLGTFERTDMVTPEREGRWPANVVHDGSDEVVDAFPATAPARAGKRNAPKTGGTFGDYAGDDAERFGHADAGGSAARFFYSAKASKADRAGSKHPTVKPIALMQWLARLITPPGGVVLDPFSGSGTTGAAALQEGFRCVMIEREAEYVADIRGRFAAKAAA